MRSSGALGSVALMVRCERSEPRTTRAWLDHLRQMKASCYRMIAQPERWELTALQPVDHGLSVLEVGGIDHHRSQRAQVGARGLEQVEEDGADVAAGGAGDALV